MLENVNSCLTIEQYRWCRQVASGGVICLLGWTFRISSGVSKRIYQSVVQGDRKFLNRIGAVCCAWILRKSLYH